MSNMIELKGVTKNYHLGGATIEALKNVDLSVGAGEFKVLVGPSGSGKSTMLNLCGLLDKPDAGDLFLDGKKTSSMSQGQLTMVRREKIGFVFQGFNLVPVMTAFENVEYPLLLAGVPTAERQERTKAILAKVELTEFSKHRPDHLSGGQRQRVAVARALVKNPSLVIADEPTANLDSKTAFRMIELMQALAEEQKTTFLVSTHDERVTNLCKQTLTLIDGELK